MKLNRQLSSLVILVAAATASGRAHAAPGHPYSDEWIEGRVSGAFSYNSTLDSSEITVDSSGRIVTIEGSVPTVVEKEYAGQIARAVDGVASVENKLSVDPALKDRPRSSFNQKISDAAISASVKSKLLLNRGTHGRDIGATTMGNVVELSGAVQSEQERKTAEQIAMSTGGVREVKNSLQLSPTGSKTESKSTDIATAVNDGWVSMQGPIVFSLFI